MIVPALSSDPLHEPHRRTEACANSSPGYCPSRSKDPAVAMGIFGWAGPIRRARTLATCRTAQIASPISRCRFLNNTGKPLRCANDGAFEILVGLTQEGRFPKRPIRRLGNRRTHNSGEQESEMRPLHLTAGGTGT